MDAVDTRLPRRGTRCQRLSMRLRWPAGSLNRPASPRRRTLTRLAPPMKTPPPQIDYVREVLSRFARGGFQSQPTEGAPAQGSSLALTGPWGTGKTYLWDRVVREVAREERLGRKHYAYVSLFGLDSLADVKAALIAHRRGGKWIATEEAVGWGNWLNMVGERHGDDVKKRTWSLLKDLVLTKFIGPDTAEAIAFDLAG